MHQARRSFRSRKLVLASLTLMAATTGLVARRMLWPENERKPAVISSSPASGEVESLRRELAQVRRESARLQFMVSEIAQRTVIPSAEADEESSAPSTAEDAPTSPPSAPSREQQLAHIEAEFEAETSDSAWNPSGELRSMANAALATGSTLREIECRRSMCRLEVAHRSLDDYKQFTDKLLPADLTQPGWTGAVAIDVRHPARAGDEIIAIGYFARDSLPALSLAQR